MDIDFDGVVDEFVEAHNRQPKNADELIDWVTKVWLEEIGGEALPDGRIVPKGLPDAMDVELRDGKLVRKCQS